MRLMTMPLSSDGSVSPAPRQADMKERRPVTGGRRSYSGGVQRFLLPHGSQGAAGAGEGAGLAIWMGGALEGSGVPSASDAGAGTGGRSSECLSSFNSMVSMIRRSMPTTSSSTIVKQVLR